MFTRPIPRYLLLALICFLAIVPFFRWGSPSGHDFEFHMYSWMEVLAQWKQGVVYPRWAAFAQWGYGEARFLFYPPGSWTLGAALGAALPWRAVPGAYCWIVLTLAGASMYGLARRWLSSADAFFAAAFYALNPYHLLVVYWRSAFAELLAAIVLPLVVLCMLRIRQDGARPVLWLGLALAGAWMANAPAAMMIHYSAAGLALVIALQESTLRAAGHVLAKTLLGILLGAGLAAFYLLPAIYEQPWVNIAALMSPGVSPQDNFLFTMMADVDHNNFNLLVSIVALSEIAVLALAVWLARKIWVKGTERCTGRRRTWTLLAVWGAGTAFAMLPASNFLWMHLPKFRFVQLPFRWLLCLNAPLALLLGMATATSVARPAATRWVVRAFSSALLVAILLVAGHRIQPPWWDQAADIQEMRDAVSDGIGYDGTDEYVPAGADPYEVNKDLAGVTDAGGAPVNAQILGWTAVDRHFKLRSNSAGTVTVRLFNYPAWHVTVNGRRVSTQTTELTGLMIVPVALGENDVEIRFGRTPDRLAGDIVSLMSAGIFAGFYFATRQKAALPRAAEEAA